MAPIPANASAAMVFFFFFVAIVVAPWLMLRLAPKAEVGGRRRTRRTATTAACLGRLYRRIATPCHPHASPLARGLFLIAVGARDRASGPYAVRGQARSPSSSCPSTTSPRSPSSSTCPEGASLETERTLFSAADIARALPEIRSIQTYAGTPAPFNFNGLVRHTISARPPNSANCSSIWSHAESGSEPAMPSHSICASASARSSSPLEQASK